MSRWRDDWDWARPIEVEGGIKGRQGRGNTAEQWWSRQWNDALSRLMDSRRLQRGRNYARKGQVLEILESPGEVNARVQGSRQTPYKVKIRVTALDERTWERVLDELAGQALFAAQLLAGEMPEGIEAVFNQAGASLFPQNRRELQTHCSCPDSANPCKHIAAVYFLLGEAFDLDPFLLFRLRGRDQEAILAGLRARRVQESPEPEPGEAEVVAEELEIQVEAPLEPGLFWGLAETLDDFQTQPREPQLDLSLLQRLEQPAFVDENIQATIGPVYREVTRRALHLAFDADEETAA